VEQTNDGRNIDKAGNIDTDQVNFTEKMEGKLRDANVLK